jgi:hypothetical protein
MTEVEYGRYDEAYKAIHSALQGLTNPQPGHKLTRLGFTWNTNGALATLLGYDGATLLFTLSFTWNGDGTLAEVARS